MKSLCFDSTHLSPTEILEVQIWIQWILTRSWSHRERSPHLDLSCSSKQTFPTCPENPWESTRTTWSTQMTHTLWWMPGGTQVLAFILQDNCGPATCKLKTWANIIGKRNCLAHSVWMSKWLSDTWKTLGEKILNFKFCTYRWQFTEKTSWTFSSWGSVLLERRYIFEKNNTIQMF